MAKKEIKRKIMGICIPYWKNTEDCEIEFKKLMEQIESQITDDMILCVYEDGQVSDWLVEYQKRLGNKMFLIQNPINYGVAYARNKIVDYLIDKCLYILFLDSDDKLGDKYLNIMCEYSADNSHEIIESTFYVNKNKADYKSDVVRCGVAGSSIQTRIIGDKRFNEHLQIGEDTNFMREVCDLKKYRKKLAPKAEYYYQLGVNHLSLTMRYDRKEIGKVR